MIELLMVVLLIDIAATAGAMRAQTGPVGPRGLPGPKGDMGECSCGCEYKDFIEYLRDKETR